jgi:hypothetical protein
MAVDVRTLQVDRAWVLGKCDSFVDFQLWPIQTTLNPEGWLKNFLSDELEHAYHLLNSFTFYSEQLVRELFLAGFQNISCIRRKPGLSFAEQQSAWRSFCSEVLVTFVTGEQPNPTDSGHLFTRIVRQHLRISERRIVEPQVALRSLVEGSQKPILFVDDFVGSGAQFVATWRRPYDVGMVGHMSFERFANWKGGAYYYCPAICTALGTREISNYCPTVQLSPGNMLGRRYSAVEPDSVVWPENLLPTGASFIETASRRAGIPATDGGRNDWRGFNKLGLCVGFNHSVPDATLPLFYWEKNGWIPLLRRG